MFCTNCGQELPDDARFCSQCGTEFNKKNVKRFENEAHNYDVISRINAWLEEVHPRITEIKLTTFLGQEGIRILPTISTFDIYYDETNMPVSYVLSYETSGKRTKSDAIAKIEKKLRKRPSMKIAWYHDSAIQVINNGIGFCVTRFFMYYK